MFLARKIEAGEVRMNVIWFIAVKRVRVTQTENCVDETPREYDREKTKEKMPEQTRLVSTFVARKKIADGEESSAAREDASPVECRQTFTTDC